jgi:hypothetical protein
MLTALCHVRSWIHELIAVLFISFATNIAATQAVAPIVDPRVWPFSCVAALMAGIFALMFAQELRANEAEWARLRSSTSSSVAKWTTDKLEQRKLFVAVAYLLPCAILLTIWLIGPTLVKSPQAPPPNPAPAETPARQR